MATDTVAENIGLPERKSLEDLEERTREPSRFEHLLATVGFETKAYSAWLDWRVERITASMAERLSRELKKPEYKNPSPLREELNFNPY